MMAAQEEKQEQQKPNGSGEQMPYRYDGRLKVTGKARYAAEFPVKNVLYAWILQSTIANGQIVAMDTTVADRASGVVKILTPFNAPKLPIPQAQPPAIRRLSLLQDRDVHYNGEPVAVVIAKTLVEAQHAASLIKVKYQASPAHLDFDHRLNEARPPKHGNAPKAEKHGDEAAAWKKAAVVLEQTYTTPLQNHNPMEPHATVAVWEGEKLTVYDATQYVSGVKRSLAKHFALPEDNIRVLDPYVGGGFGSKGSMWSHVVLCALAAKVVGQPVKLALDRQQMFGPVGGRPATVQHIKLGTDKQGRFVAINHSVIEPASVMEDFLEPSAKQTDMLYACDQISTAHSMVDMNIGVQTFMRAPGEATGTSALESAMDELAEKLKMDPVELRLVNYAEKDPGTQREWSSKNLRAAYADAAKRFGWEKRNPRPGQTREGNKLIGYGMATATYAANRSAAQATLKLLPNGRLEVASGTQDLGTGTYTIMTQTVMQELGVPFTEIDTKLGDSSLPKAPVSGGSQSAASVGPAVKEACNQLKLKLASLAVDDASSPLHGAKTEDIEAKGGKIQLKSDASKSEPFIAAIKRNGGKALSVQGSAEPSEEAERSLSTHSWGAIFAEVAVDASTYMVEVRRIVATYDIGTLLNKKTGISQLEGGLVWGLGFALMEESHLDPVYGRIANANLAEYHVPTNADTQSIDVAVLGIPDLKFSPQGGRGVGEIGITGIGGAIANAIYNATGKRVRNFPITPDKIMRA